MSGFEVLLDLHPEDISVDRKSELLRHLIHFSLFEIDQTSHVTKSALEIQFGLFALLNFFSQSFLVLVDLAFDLLVVASEIHVQIVDLVFFDYKGVNSESQTYLMSFIDATQLRQELFEDLRFPILSRSYF